MLKYELQSKALNTFIYTCTKAMTVHLLNWIQGEMNKVKMYKLIKLQIF
jgi:hypothetical protein